MYLKLLDGVYKQDFSDRHFFDDTYRMALEIYDFFFLFVLICISLSSVCFLLGYFFSTVREKMMSLTPYSDYNLMV